jgi:hypothetical protein
VKSWNGFIWLRTKAVVGSYEEGNEIVTSIKCRLYSEKLNYYHFLKKGK